MGACSAVRDAIGSMADTVGALKKQCGDLSSDKKSLESKIKKRKAELERSEKRLGTLQNVKYDASPAPTGTHTHAALAGCMAL